MLWLGGFLSLDLTTTTPDALCPPLEEARAAVKARVGEVRGEYHAEFALVRADDGRRTLDLTLREGESEVLRRELPVDAAGCQDAAQTIALVLERYFDAIERPVPSDPAPKLESVPDPPPPPLRLASANRQRADRPVPAEPIGLDFRAGALFDAELGLAAVLGASFYPRVLRGSHWGVGFTAEMAPFFARQTEILREKQVEAFLVQGAFGVPLTWTRSTWLVSAGPWLQLRLQRADAPSVVGEQPALRALPGLGGFMRAGVNLSSSIGLLAGIAAGPQFRGAASRFVLEGAAGQIEVLVPNAWFGHGQLTLELKF